MFLKSMLMTRPSGSRHQGLADMLPRCFEGMRLVRLDFCPLGFVCSASVKMHGTGIVMEV